MAFTQEQLDALDEAIASGARDVRWADKSVTYQSLDDMLRARRTIAAALGGDTDRDGLGGRRVLMSHDRG